MTILADLQWYVWKRYGITPKSVLGWLDYARAAMGDDWEMSGFSFRVTMVPRGKL